MRRRAAFIVITVAALALLLTAAKKNSRPAFLGTWVYISAQGEAVVSFDSDGTYMLPSTLGRWKPAGQNVLEMTDESGTRRLMWKVSEDGKALFLKSMPSQSPGTNEPQGFGTVYTRK